MEGSLCCSSYHPNCPKGRRYRALGALQPRMPSHLSRTRKRQERMGSISTPVQPPEAEAPSLTGPRQIVWTILWMTMLLCSKAASVNLHQPVRITWKLQNGLTREMLNSTTTIHPPNTWWPGLYFDPKPVVNVPWKRGYLWNHAFWVCPGAPRHNWKICGGIQDSYCKS